jgi:hypothetical protein
MGLRGIKAIIEVIEEELIINAHAFLSEELNEEVESPY